MSHMTREERTGRLAGRIVILGICGMKKKVSDG